MEIKRGGSQPSTKGPSDWFTGLSVSIHFFRHLTRLLFRAPVSRLSRAHVLRGTRIHSARLLS